MAAKRHKRLTTKNAKTTKKICHRGRREHREYRVAGCELRVKKIEYLRRMPNGKGG